MASIDWNSGPTISKDDMKKLEKLAKMAKPGSVIPSSSPGIGVYSAKHLPYDIEDKFAKVTKENEKLLELIMDITTSLTQLENAPILARNEFKNLNTIILSRVGEIIDGK